MDLLILGSEWQSVIDSTHWPPASEFRQGLPVILLGAESHRHDTSMPLVAATLEKPVRKESLRQQLEAIVSRVRNGPILLLNRDQGMSEKLAKSLQALGWRTCFSTDSAMQPAGIPDCQPIAVVMGVTEDLTESRHWLESLRRDAKTAQIPVILTSSKQIDPLNVNYLDQKVTKVLAQDHYSYPQLIEQINVAIIQNVA